MIDFKQTCEIHGMTPYEIEKWFEMYPKSNKKAVMVCDVCGEERIRNYTSYKPLCRSCGKKEYWSDPDVRARYAQTMRVHYDDPEYRAIQSRKKIEYWADTGNRLAQSDRLRKSSSKEANLCMAGENGVSWMVI